VRAVAERAKLMHFPSKRARRAVDRASRPVSYKGAVFGYRRFAALFAKEPGGALGRERIG
jgi:hypothetical protein